MPENDVNALQQLHDALQEIVRSIASEAGAVATPRVELTRPTEERFGDYASNVALMLAPVIGERNPRAVGQRIADHAGALPGVGAVDIAGPGFVNITMDDRWYLETLGRIRDAGDRYGSGVAVERERVSVEYVSANPLGPLVAVAARHAAYGDALARMLTWAGNDVETEFYVNDAGRQVQLFGESILARATGGEVPEGGYQGDYVSDLATDLGVAEGDDPAEVGLRGVEAMLGIMRPALERFGVHHDCFQSELELHGSGIVEEALELLEERGHLFEQEGATFLRTTTFGDDKDRAVRRSNGQVTYFAADIGYLLHKYRRGYDRLIYVLGADHHGYIARLKAAAAALGHDPDRCEIVIIQMVSLIEAGEQKRMSKRRGDFVTMDELLERVSTDAARFFMLQRSHDQSLDLDIELAAEQTEQNPVYYVQYAHARICSIMRRAQDEAGLGLPDELTLPEGYELHPSERRLIKRLAELPMLVRESTERRTPHKLTHYSHDLALDFSKFYRDCRVMGDGVTRDVGELRLALCEATRSVLRISLGLLGVAAPERM